jgi:superfamily II DNA or RNA helicase
MFRPEDILELVKFNAENKKWKYDSNKKDLFAYQAEGVAGVLNRFKIKGIALLADEVGMGKTIQALSVIAHQFKERSNSNILVIVPRKEMLNQWKNQEYKEFLNKHIVDKTLLPAESELVELENLHSGFCLPHDKSKNIVFCKTTSFSHIEENELEKLKNDISKFDLIVVDESHQYRNYDDKDQSSEDSLRIKNAKEIFATIDNYTNILLMTATPLHSKKGDVKRVVELFKKDNGATDEEIMKNIMIRRLRVMTNGANKYHYREESDIPVKLSVNGSLKNEIFFAMLQKAFVNSSNELDLSKSKHLLDYLEGTNFDIKDEDKSDIKKIVNKVVTRYKKSYNELPSNQKYDEVIQKINQSNEKALVFVRRKASAYELTRRAIEEFDKKAWGIIEKSLGHKSICMPEDRGKFNKIIQLYSQSLSESKFSNFKEKRKIKCFFEDYKRLNKEFFKGKHKDTILKDMAENYYLVFDKYSEKNFEEFKDIIKNNSNNKKQSEDKVSKSEDRIPKSIVLDFFKQKRDEPSTDASRFVSKFKFNSDYENIFSELLPKLLNYEKSKAELIKSAVLHSSIGVVELYALYLKTDRNFKKFQKAIEKNRDNLIFMKEIKDFIEHFDKFEKYLSSNENAIEIDSPEDKESMEKTNMFHNSQPAYPYVSDTKNKYVIARFNSPFFPYMLCGTSILQEGVNLHLFCNKVYHFGAAHTMGDDEQRVGRVDRVMGKMDRELYCDKDKKLKIYYPYLESTFDERNLQKMLTQKRDTEEQIDTCQIASNSQNEEYQRNFYQSIKKLLHQSRKEVKAEPYSWEN